MLITADQIRAARALKNWSQTDLAERTGLAVPTIANIELGKQMPGKNTIEKIIASFESAGIEFLGETGVQKKLQTTRVFRGVEEFKKFYDVIYESVLQGANEVLVGNVDERDFIKHMDPDILQLHLDRMVALNTHYKILVCEGDYFFPVTKYAEYRWMNKEDFSSIPFYVFADKLAIILLLDEPIVFLLEDKISAQIYKEKFLAQWKKSKKPPQSDQAIMNWDPYKKDEFLKLANKKARK
jgi:transcriptional regulator with XRE-family HTH domain